MGNDVLWAPQAAPAMLPCVLPVEFLFVLTTCHKADLQPLREATMQARQRPPTRDARLRADAAGMKSHL